MNTRTRTDIIPKIQQYLATQPVERAWLFGSFSRGEEREDSDVDILVSIDRSVHVGLIKLSGMLLEIQDRLNRKVDLVTEKGLMDFARASVERDKILIYERTE
ncbi:MAG: nucleotidyltransferase family protein [Prevotella sp.]